MIRVDSDEVDNVTGSKNLNPKLIKIVNFLYFSKDRECFSSILIVVLVFMKPIHTFISVVFSIWKENSIYLNSYPLLYYKTIGGSTKRCLLDLQSVSMMELMMESR